MSDKPVFLDVTGRRATRISLIGWVAAIVSTALGIGFVASMFAVPQLEHVRLPGELSVIHAQELENKATAPGLVPTATQLAREARLHKMELIRKRKLWIERNSRTRALAATMNPHPGRPLSIAFFPNWEASAYDSLKVALPQLDWVMPTWLSLSGPDLVLKDSYDKRVYTLIRRSKKPVAVLPVVQNATLGKWDGPGLAKLLADPKRSAALIKQLDAFVQSHKLQGIVVDFEAIPDSSQADLGRFLRELRKDFKPHGWKVAMAEPFANDKWPFADYAKDIDYTILMAYDEHLTPNAPGSIAGQSWYENTLDKRMRGLDPARTIVALGSYAYDWDAGGIDSLSFEEAVIAAHDSGAEVVFDDATNNPHFS